MTKGEILNIVNASFRGAWLAGTDYLTGEQVTSGGNTYRAKVDFASGATFDVTNWALIAQGGQPADGTIGREKLTTMYAAQNARIEQAIDLLQSAQRIDRLTASPYATGQRRVSSSVYIDTPVQLTQTQGIDGLTVLGSQSPGNVSAIFSAFTWVSGKAIRLTGKVTAAASNPSVGFGYGTIGSLIGLAYRQDGSVLKFDMAASAVTLARTITPAYAFVVGDTIAIEYTSTGQLVTYLNGVASATFSFPTFTPTSTLSVVFQSATSLEGMKISLTEPGATTPLQVATAAQATANTAQATAITAQTGATTATAKADLNTSAIDLLTYGVAPNRLSAIPYATAAKTAAWADGSATVSQVVGTDGVSLGITTTLSGGSAISFITTDAVWTAGKITRLLFDVTNLQADTAFIGLGWGTSATMQANTRRTTGFAGILNVATSLFIAGISEPSSAFVVGSKVEIRYDPASSSMTTYVNGLLVSTTTTTTGTPTGAISIVVRGKISIANTKIVIVDQVASSGVSGSVYYVATSGSDSNVGSKAAPFLSINKALGKAVGQMGTKIIIAGGDYRETLNLTAFSYENVSLIAESKAVVRVLGSTQLTGWTKTAGYTNIYEASFGGTIPTWSHNTTENFIFEDGNPSKPILTAEIHPLQKGLANRLPYTEIASVVAGADLAATLIAMDTTSGRYFFSGGKVYLHASSSGNPTSNGYSYEIASRAPNTYPDQAVFHAKASLYLEHIRFLFGLDGFVSSGFAKVERWYCVSLGNAGGGAFRDDVALVLSYHDEGGGCASDGFNQHYDAYYGSSYTSHDVRRGVSFHVYYDSWAHDNHDDGMSTHNRGEVSVYGGLSEYNGDSGYIPANGGTYRCYNCIARNNGQQADGNPSAGFATVGDATGTGRNATTLLAFGCVSDGNKYGFSSGASGISVVRAINCVSRNNLTFEYAGNLIAENCRATNADPAKLKNGAVTVKNDAILS